MSDTQPAAGASGGQPRREVRGMALAVVAGVALGLLMIAVWSAVDPLPPTAREIRRALLDEVQPVALKNCTLERFGSPNDGGYLMCGNLLGGIQAAYSYGIGVDDNWGCEMSRRFDVTVHRYDCFDPARPECPGGRAVFHDECIGPKAETIDSRVFDTLENQIAKNGDRGKTLVVKIDVEGAELESLLATPDAVLERFDQLAMEIHGANRDFLEMVRKLKRTFHVAHLHFNNSACAVRWAPLPSRAYEVLFVNKRIGIHDPSLPRPVLPHPLDAPVTLIRPDCQAPLD
jgi:hypothetical protein